MMEMITINSGSGGNCYLLRASSGETLLIECGVPYAEILRAVNFKVSSIVGCVASHPHGDHIRSIFHLLADGVKIYASRGTFDAKRITGHHNTIPIANGEQVQIGSFQVKAFDINHDAPEPLGFLIWHEEMGLTLFMTDSYYMEYRDWETPLLS